MTIREHLAAVNAALVTGEYGRIDQHVKAMRRILDEAEADMFDDETGMVALVPDGTVWKLRNGVGPWIRTDRPDPLASRGDA